MYLDDVRKALVAELVDTLGLDPGDDLHVDVPPWLLDCYVLLLLSKGAATTPEDVHNAWALWWSREDEDGSRHPAMIPWSDLKPQVQDLDDPYVEAIHRAAKPE